MSNTLRKIVIYKEEKKIPLLDWMDTLSQKAQEKLFARFLILSSEGENLRRPMVDYLQDGVFELRMRHNKVHHRVLYFFDGKELIVLTGGFVKKTGKVPKSEIDKAMKRKDKYLKNKAKHTFTM